MQWLLLLLLLLIVCYLTVSPSTHLTSPPPPTPYQRQFERWSRPWRVRSSSGKGGRAADANSTWGSALIQPPADTSSSSSITTSTAASSSSIIPLVPRPLISLLEIVPAFHALLPRHDLHRPPGEAGAAMEHSNSGLDVRAR